MSTAIQAVGSAVQDLLQDHYALRCGHPLAACGAGRLGAGVPWPWGDSVSAYCNVARCGASYCGRIATDSGGVYAGMRPTMYSRHITLALTEDMGGTPDPRQVYDTAYDNPAMTLRIVGDDLEWLDYFARYIREELDMTSHISTDYGTINGLRIGPASRTNRPDRPRYEVALPIRAEYIRPSEED